MAKKDNKKLKEQIQRKFKERGRFEIDLHIKMDAIDNSFVEVPPAEEMRVPLRQQDGLGGKPIVEKGQFVKYGEKIGGGEDEDWLTVPVHSPVNGIVKEVTKIEHPISGIKEPAVIIETKDEDKEPYYEPIDPEKTSGEELIEHIRERGIVGLGGAVFPTHAKLSDGVGKVSHMIINADEGDPDIACDVRLMMENPSEIIDGIKIMGNIVGAKKIIFATREKEPPEFEKHLKEENIELINVRPSYSVGYGRLLVTEILGKEVPHDKNPTDVGALVHNVSTAYAISKALREGESLVSRGFTYYSRDVGGRNLRVRIGTPVSKVFEFIGESPTKFERVVLGEVMRGQSIPDPSTPIIKSHHGVVAFTEEEPHPYEEQKSCIRCGYCNTICPVDIYPQLILEAQDRGDSKWLKKLNPAACIDCGLCAYVCPSHINFRPRLAKATSEIRKSSLKKK